ncbi:MAG: hypothetical protein V4561_11655 [Bacteroidota bacterium]
MKTFLPFFLLLSISLSVSAQKITAKVIMENNSKRKHEIVYRKGTQLSLADFQGDYEEGVDAVAMAYSGVTVNYNAMTKNGQIFLEIRMYASFDKSKSWCLSKSRNERTLAHEQRHFDITAKNACALFRALKSYHFTRSFEQEIFGLQEKYRKKNEEEQDIYDSESNHGINKEKQAEWNENVIKQLDACEDCFE